MLIGLDQLCGCAEGRAELLNHGAGLTIASKKILRVSHVASDRGVRIMSSICRYSANSIVLHEMLHVGAVSKLCLVLRVDSNFNIDVLGNELFKREQEDLLTDLKDIPKKACDHKVSFSFD
jgi:hypothetical protein